VLSLGAKYVSELNYDSAILEYIAAIEQDPQNVEAYAGLYSAYIASGQPEKAKEVLATAKKELGDDTELYDQILDNADLIQRSGGGTKLYENLSEIYSLEELNEENVAFSKRLSHSWLQADPQNAAAYVPLYVLYSLQGDDASAKQLLEQADSNGTDLEKLQQAVIDRAEGLIDVDSILVLFGDLLPEPEQAGETPELDSEPAATPEPVVIQPNPNEDAAAATKNIAGSAASQAGDTVIQQNDLDQNSAAAQLIQDTLQAGLSSMG
jgi:tetratricopeptide (TPR) repeat protein